MYTDYNNQKPIKVSELILQHHTDQLWKKVWGQGVLESQE